MTVPPSRRSRSTSRCNPSREGRQVFTGGLLSGAIYFTSVLSLPYVLDTLVPALAETLAGEGAVTIEVPTTVA